MSLNKCLKSSISEDPSTSDMENRPKQFIDPSEGN